MEGNHKVLRSDEVARWHWVEGNKYVIEGGKSLFWLNGGAAAGMLTFLGNERATMTCSLRAGICLFALGSLFAAALFTSAYITQLNYGNGNLSWAERWHCAGYASAIPSVVFFAAGVFIIALNL